MFSLGSDACLKATVPTQGNQRHSRGARRTRLRNQNPVPWRGLTFGSLLAVIFKCMRSVGSEGRGRWEVELMSDVSSSLWHWRRTRKACLDFSWQACHSQPECRWQCCDSWRNLHRFGGNLCWCQEPAECHSASPRLKRCVPRFSEQLLVY